MADRFVDVVADLIVFCADAGLSLPEGMAPQLLKLGREVDCEAAEPALVLADALGTIVATMAEELISLRDPEEGARLAAAVRTLLGEEASGV